MFKFYRFLSVAHYKFYDLNFERFRVNFGVLTF